MKTFLHTLGFLMLIIPLTLVLTSLIKEILKREYLKDILFAIIAIGYSLLSLYLILL